MAIFARKFLTTADNIAITSTVAGDGFLVGYHFAFKLDTGATSFESGGARYLVNSGGTANFNSLYMDKDVAFAGPHTTNYFLARFTDGVGFQDFLTTFDPFAGMPGDSVWHYFSLDWNPQGHGGNGSCILTIDNAIYSSEDASPVIIRVTGNALHSPYPNYSDGILIGAGAALVGMAISDFGAWGRDLSPTATTIFNYPSDMNAFAAGAPAEVIQIGTLVDVLPITGASPELGFLGIFTGTITGTSVVSGPPLTPPYSVVATARRSGIGHTPGEIIVDFTWLRNNPFPGGVALTCTPSVGSMVSSSVTLTDGPTDTISATIIIPPLTTPGDYVLEVTNSDDLQSLTVPFHVAVPLVEIKVGDARIAANGNILKLFPTRVDNGAAVSAEVFDLTGATIENVTAGGGPQPLDSRIAAYTGTNGQIFCWTSVKTQHEHQYRVNANAVQSGGTWGTTTQQSGQFCIFNLNASAVGIGGLIGYSPDAGATSVDTFTGVTPGRLYGIYTPLNDILPGNAQTVGGTATTQARRTITDGATSAHYDDNQTLRGTYAADRRLYQLALVGTIRPTTSTVTVTLTNQAGTGTLYNNGHILILHEENFSIPTDVVVLTLPDNAIKTPGALGTTGPTTITCTMETPQSQAPFNPSLESNLELGYNTGFPNANSGFGTIWANHRKMGYSWGLFTGSGTWPEDGHGQLTGIGPAQTLHIDYLGGSFTNLTNGGVYWANSHNFAGVNGETGPKKARFTVPIGGDPHCRFYMIAYDNGDHSGDYTAGDNGGLPIVLEQTPHSVFPTGWGETWGFEVKANGSALDYVEDLVIFDGLTPADWPNMVHPVFHERVADRFTGWIRWMTMESIGSSNVYDWSHQMDLRDMPYTPARYLGVFPITAIEPISVGTETDLCNYIFGTGHGGGYYYVWAKITTSVPHGLVTESVLYGGNFYNVDWSVVLDTNGGNINIYADAIHIIKLSDTQFIAALPTTSFIGGNAPLPVQPNTLAGSITMGGSENFQQANVMIPFQDMIDITLEMRMKPHLNFPITSTDDLANKLGQCFQLRSNPGDQGGVEFSNERWNSGVVEWHREKRLFGANQYLWDSTGHAQGYFCESQTEWGSLRAHQLGAQFAAGGTGIPEVRIEGYGSGATGVAVLSGGQVFHITLTNGGTGYTSAPTVHILGSAGTGATATATIDGSGHVTGFTVTNGGSGYVPTGRDANDFKTIFGSFALDGVSLEGLMASATRHNFPVPILSVATYIRNIQAAGDYGVMPGGGINVLMEQLSVGDLCDIYIEHFKATDWSGGWSNAIARLEAAGIHGTELHSYEGGTDLIINYYTEQPEAVRRSQEMVCHSTMFHNEMHILQTLEHTYGFKSRTIFTYNDPSGTYGGAQWTAFYSDLMPVGSGNPAENARIWDMRDQYSQTAGAHRAYSAYVPTESLMLTGPSSGTTGIVSTNFTVEAILLSSSDTVTLVSDSGGTFSPTSLSFASGSDIKTFTYTPTADGAHSISITDTLGIPINGSPITYTSSTPTPTPTPTPSSVSSVPSAMMAVV